MNYAELEPKIELSTYIDCIWISDFTNDETRNQITIADGYSEMVFKFSQANYNFNPDHLEEKYIIGEKTKYKAFEVNNNDIFIGIKIKPGFLYPLINIPMYEIRDKSVLLDLINSKLFSNLDDFKDKHDFIDSIQDRLKRLYNNSKELHNTIKKAVNIIISKNGTINIKELSRETCMCPRNLERRFNHYVGISPKKLCRLIRFNNIRKIAMSEKNFNYTDLALCAGYSDQAHFNHDFKEFTGHNPSKIYSEINLSQISIHRKKNHK
jgi:AraC-like DNA-binding protein